eukprot:scaffold5.g948.t1
MLVEDDISPLEAVTRYSAEGNHLLQRISYISSIPAAAAESSAGDAAGVLIPLLVQLSFEDDPEIRHAVAQRPAAGEQRPASEAARPAGAQQQAEPQQRVARGGGGGVSSSMQEELLELLVVAQRLLHDPETLVQESAEVAVAGLAALLTPAQRADQLASVLASVCESQGDEELQECAARLLVRLVGEAGLGRLDPAWCQRVALPRLLALVQHPSYGVRLELAAAVPPLVPALPLWQRTDVLLPAFSRLCLDPVWSVRQEAAGEFAALASHLNREELRDVVLPLYRKMLGDVSSWVKSSARRQAGALLATMHAEDATPDLVEAFTSSAGEMATLAEAAARALPAVLRALGPRRWGELAPAVAGLAASDYVTVRATLADVVADLAAALSREDVERDILPVLARLGADDYVAVTDALALHIRPLLAALPPGARAAQLGLLARLRPEAGSSQCGQWRARLLVADQLAGIAELVGGQLQAAARPPTDAAAGDQAPPAGGGSVLGGLLLPAALRLCCDPVAEVRAAAAAQLGQMLAALLADDGSGGEGEHAGGEGAAVEQTVEAALGWQQSKSHRQRQTFVAVCSALLLPAVPPAALPDDGMEPSAPPLLPPEGHPTVERLFAALLALAEDKVPNVRMVVARLLARLARPAGEPGSHWAAARPDLAAALEALANDNDSDVRQAAAQPAPRTPAAPAGLRSRQRSTDVKFSPRSFPLTD